MARDLPIANDMYLVMFDRNYQIADIYYPHIGNENHALGHVFRLGFFVDDKFSWASSWQKTAMNYVEDTLVTNVILENVDLGIKLTCNDCVDMVSPIYLKSIEITNLEAREREIRVFFAHDFYLKGSSFADTAYYDPNRTKALIHYKGDTYFLMNVLTDAGYGIFQYACGIKDVNGALGAWKDAEDGLLSGNPIAQGSVDSVISTRLIAPPGGKASLHYWMIAGRSYDEVERRDSFVKTRKPQNMIKRTADFWRLWSRKETIDAADLGPKILNLYKRSLLTIRSQWDGNGAIIAANDTETIQSSRDTYSYMWPRDASFIAMAMDDAGYGAISRRFFEFCSKIILPQGWYFHKYQPDGSPGSSWHPWIIGNEPQLPIQEDETALVVLSLWHHFKINRDVDAIKPFYRPIVKNAANFMISYRDETTGLPLESYDLWEERRGVFTFTSSAVSAGLAAAANFASSFGEIELAESYAKASKGMKDALLNNLFDSSNERFLRGCHLTDGRVSNYDSTVDSSLAGVFIFDILPPDDPRIVSTMKQVEEKLTAKTSIGGIARYEQDKYWSTGDKDSTGNPWFISTLWLAEWHIRSAKKVADLEVAKNLMNWAASHAYESGIMPEQIDPRTGAPLSVSPLTWSHGVFLDCYHLYVRKYRELSGN